MPQKKLSKTRQEIHRQYEENELADLKQRQTRARSLSVGTAGGGLIELNMRGDFANLWYQMQPTETVELINQLAASIGVEIAMRPRQDFASWRSWDLTLPASISWVGTAPWQLSEEDRALLAEHKAKNIKAIESSDESKSE
jgi:hypothetical protein